MNRRLAARRPKAMANNPGFVPVVHEGSPKHKGPATHRNNELQIVSMTLQEGEDLTVGQRIREILANARKNATL